MDGLLRDGGFQAALVAAALLAAAAWPLRTYGDLHLGWPLVALAGSVVGLSTEHRLDPTLLWALLLLGAAGALATRAPVVAQTAACVPGAVVLVQALPPTAATWMRVLAIGSTAVAAPLVLACGRALPRVMPVLLLGSVMGVWVCVPETGPIHNVLGAMLPAVVLAVLVEQLPHASVVWPLVGVTLWAAVTGGVARPGAVVGGVACLGVFLLVPLVRWQHRSWADGAVLLVTDAGVVLFAAHVAGFRESAWVAAALCVPVFALAWLVLAVTRRHQL